MLLSRVPTLFTYIQLNLNVFSMKLVVRTGQTSTRSLRFVIASILRFAIALLSNSTFLVSTPTSYELYNSSPDALHLLCRRLLVITIIIITNKVIQWNLIILQQLAHLSVNK